MERRKFLQHAGITGILAAGAAPAIAQSAPTVKWRLTSSFPKSLDTIYGGAEVLSKRPAAMTGGRFTVQVWRCGAIRRAVQARPSRLTRTVTPTPPNSSRA